MFFIFRTLIEWRKFIIVAALLTTIVTAGISLILPKWWAASTSVFPPETKSGFPGYADILQSFQLPLLGPSAVGTNPTTVYIDILQSRTVCEKVVEEFGFKKLYKIDSDMEAIAELRSHTFYSLLDNGLLKVGFEDRDPERAAEVANRYVELLDEYNRQINITRASKTRQFIASQIDLHKAELNKAEDKLRAFQEEYKALELGDQIRSAIEVVSGLTAEAVGLEVELQILRQYTSAKSEEYARKKKHYDGILEQLKKFKVGGARSEDDVVRSFFPTLENVPEISLELARLTRRVKIENGVYQLLITEFERARIEEARDTPTVQILDIAKSPEKRSRPKRKVLVLIGGILGLGWSSLVAVFLTGWRSSARREGSLSQLFAPIASDLQRLRRKKP